MTDANQRRRVIPSREVKRDAAPVLVECHQRPDGGSDTIAVVPLTEGGNVRGFEVRCQCGAAVIVECVYADDYEQKETGE